MTLSIIIFFLSRKLFLKAITFIFVVKMSRLVIIHFTSTVNYKLNVVEQETKIKWTRRKVLLTRLKPVFRPEYFLLFARFPRFGDGAESKRIVTSRILLRHLLVAVAGNKLTDSCRQRKRYTSCIIKHFIINSFV